MEQTDVIRSLIRFGLVPRRSDGDRTLYEIDPDDLFEDHILDLTGQTLEIERGGHDDYDDDNDDDHTFVSNVPR